MKTLFLFLLLLGILHAESIAILTPVTHKSLAKIEEGFRQTMGKEFSITTYNALGNKTLMRSMVDEIIRKDYELIFTIGTVASQMTVEVLHKKGKTTPVVFTCVNDPLSFQIIPHDHVTGVIELLDFEAELGHLLEYKQDIKRLLLVYNPLEPGLSKDYQQIQKILKNHEIELMTVEVFATNEMKHKVTPFIEKSDAVVILKDNTCVQGLDLLVKLCEKENIPLMASDLDSPDQGATLGYGVNETDFGVEGAKKALLILKEHKKPSEIEVTPVCNFILKVKNA